MKFLTKTISSILLVTFISSNVLFGFSITAHAQAGEILAVPTKDAALRSTSCGVAIFGICVPFTSLDSFAWFAAKVIIQQLTADLVNWINSGFDGNPAFVDNPAGFFTNIVDEQIGLMIEQSADLNFLCSPFSIDIRLALAFKYRPFKKKVTCTLTEIISNSKGAIEGASINGFTAGDFKQGGWPAFISMTTEPQNNIYGAYMEAENELSIRIGNKELLRRDEINQGRGFLSWKKCTKYADQETEIEGGYTTDPETGAQMPIAGGSSSSDTDAQAAASGTNDRVCVSEQTQTPGSVIESSLETQLGTGVRQLELADSFNEITNALVAQLINQVLTKGLRAASGSGPSDVNSYIDQLEKDKAQENERLNSVKTDVLTKIDTTLQRENNFKSLKTITINQLIEARQKLDEVKSCYVDKLENENLTQNREMLAEQRIDSINEMISESITPYTEPILNDLNVVNENILVLNQTKSELSQAITLNQVYGPTQTFSTLTEGDTLHTVTDITDATGDRDEITARMLTLKTQATTMLQECQLFQ